MQIIGTRHGPGRDDVSPDVTDGIIRKIGVEGRVVVSQKEVEVSREEMV